MALILIIIMVVFGAALNMDEDGDLFGSAGDGTIVEVARAELGNKGGEKYWKWYGFTSHVDWCACFVSWCADQCGYIEDGVLPRFSVVGDGAKWFKDSHRWAGSGYTPNPGDIIFFDFDQNGVPDHVGIVESCDGKTITTIEGNSSDACRRNSYRVGSSVIAGYGLMIQTGSGTAAGSKAQLLADKATELAYPDSTKEADYPGGKPTDAYAKALDRAYPNRSTWGKPPKKGASCDVFVGVCVRDSGIDKKFPRGLGEQVKRMEKRTDLYECVVSVTSRNLKKSELKDGDIIVINKSSGGMHICIWVDGKVKQAAYSRFYPRTDKPGYTMRIKGKKRIRVYRIKE